MFDYDLDYKNLNLREDPYLYHVGRGEQGVLMVEPYKSELLPLWRFKTPKIAKESASALFEKFLEYKKEKDFVGMDMARKFIQMGFTRSRRYANHSSGRKYADHEKKKVLPLKTNQEKARSAEVFKSYLQKIKRDPVYVSMKEDWVLWYG